MRIVGKRSDVFIKVARFTAFGRHYAVEIQYVTEIIYFKDVTPLPKAPEFIEGVIELRRIVIPVINLKSHLGIGTPETTAAEHILIVNFCGQRAGIIVDKVQTIISVPKKMVQASQSENNNLLKGVFKDNSNIIMLLNVPSLLTSNEIGFLKAAV